MRGKYHTDHEDRRRFFHSMYELCRGKADKIDMIGTHLCLRDCIEMLDELGYCQGDWDIDTGEGEIWATFVQEGYPSITVLSDAYLGRLEMFWSEYISGDSEKVKELMRKHWGKYFPVI